MGGGWGAVGRVEEAKRGAAGRAGEEGRKVSDKLASLHTTLRIHTTPDGQDRPKRA